MAVINNSASTNYTLGGVSNTITSNTLPVTLLDSSEISITKSSSKTTFMPGAIIPYTIEITNSGTNFLSGVRIIDNLGAGNLAYVVGSAKLTVNGNTYSVSPTNTNPLTFALQQLNVGQSMVLEYNAQVIFNLPPSVTIITNSVEGIGYTASGQVSGFANNTITKTASGNFSIAKSSSATTVGLNQSFNYYITLTNTSSGIASVSNITDNLPDNFVISSVALQMGTGSIITLQPSDYDLSSGNILSVPSSSGPTITVPAFGTTVLTITGYFA